VRDALTGAGLSKARIGADAVSEGLSQAAQAIGAPFSIAPAGREMRRLRWSKHPEELDAMRTAAQLSDTAFHAYRETLKPGCVLAEVDWSIGAKLAGEGARRLNGQNFTITSLSTVSGLAAQGPKGDGAPTGKTLEDNAIAISTIVTRLNGVTMEVARPWIVGKPSSEAISYLDCAYNAQRAAMDQGIAGKPVKAMHLAAQKVIEDAGCGEFFHLRAGHGIGVVMHDFPEDLAFNERPLVERETYAIEPALWVPKLGGFRYGDIIAVGAQAPDILTRTSTERAFLQIA
jgi:Xaa-Pro aminopeptidase